MMKLKTSVREVVMQGQLDQQVSDLNGPEYILNVSELDFGSYSLEFSLQNDQDKVIYNNKA